MEQLEFILLEAGQQDAVKGKDRSTQPKACQSCSNFINLGWEKYPLHPLNEMLKTECETMVGLCELKDKKLFGNQICGKFKIHIILDGNTDLQNISNRPD
ncbi:MAG: hypothetical protein CMK63_11840 [Pseudoalteromonadaceae bacterium]|nr:hypothetical protein [Pseudoalteromonadaceae bacterium]|tara:strand:- start:1416 stop:1715 length:300 start_codon:yes stop_codon:yes gene_type:complete